MQKVKLGLWIIVFVLLGAGQAMAAAPASMWDLSGTVTARIGSVSQSAPATGMLALAADRTYVFQVDGEPVADVGAWFEIRGKFLLFTQNLLEQVTDLEDQLATDLGEPVEITPLKSKSKVSVNAKTGLLSVRSGTTLQAFFPQSNLTLRISLSANLTGTQV